MSLCLRSICLIVAVGSAGAATAEDAYYDVPLQELRLVEGSLPTVRAGPNWLDLERVSAMPRYAAVDDQGEAGVGPADVADQHREGDSVEVVRAAHARLAPVAWRSNAARRARRSPAAATVASVFRSSTTGARAARALIDRANPWKTASAIE